MLGLDYVEEIDDPQLQKDLEKYQFYMTDKNYRMITIWSFSSYIILKLINMANYIYECDYECSIQCIPLSNFLLRLLND